MGFKIVEDRPTPKEVYNWRIYFFATVAGAGAMTFGYDGAFIGTTIARSSFQTNFGLAAMDAGTRADTTANITAVYLGAAFFGALFAWPLMEKWGRVWTMRIAAAVFNIGALVMTIASTQLSMIYAGRVITGLGVGALTAVIPSFIAEVSPPAIRGQLTGYFEVAYQVGAVVGFWINYGINQTIPATQEITYRIPMAVQLVPGGFLAIGSIFLRESPALLIRKGRIEQAMRNLCYLRQLPEDHKYIQEEVGMIRIRIEEEAQLAGGDHSLGGYVKGALKELKVKHIRHRVIITFFMFLFQNFSGAACINYYSPTIFASLGVSDVALYTGIYGLVKAVGAITFFVAIVDRSGRRLPWLISASVCGAFLLYLGVFSIVGHPQTGNLSDSTRAGGQFALASIMLYSLFWSFGGNGLPWIVSAEIFPIRLRSITGAFAAMTQWLASYASTTAFPKMVISPIGVGGSFIFFFFVCMATFIFTFVWIPETKAIPIECMQELFSGPVRHAAWRQKKVYPPNGMPPFPQELLAAQAAGKPEDAHASSKEDVDYYERSQA